jgi:hypothetical protein
LSNSRSHFSFVVVVILVVEGPVSTGSSKHWQLFNWASCGFLLGSLSWGGSDFIQGMDKVASRTVWTEADTVVGATQVGLVLGMSRHNPQLLIAVSELTFVSVFASAVLLEWTTHFSFVTVGILDRARGHGGALG